MKPKIYTLFCMFSLLLFQPVHADGYAASGFAQGLANSPMGNLPRLMMQKE